LLGDNLSYFMCPSYLILARIIIQSLEFLFVSFAFVGNKQQIEQTSRKGAKSGKKSKSWQEETTVGSSQRARKVARWSHATGTVVPPPVRLFARFFYLTLIRRFCSGVA